MKNIILAFILLCITYPAAGQIKFEEGDFKSAIEKARLENKLIFVDCYTSWCGPCKQMAAAIFPSKEAGEFMNTRFICYKADMEKGEGIEIRKKYNVNAFPTLLILKSNGEELNRIAGMNPDVSYFIAKMEELSNPQNSLEFKKEQYEKDLTAANKYLEALYAARKYETFEKVLMETFNRREPEQRYTPENFNMYDTFLEGINHPLAALFLNDKQNFIKYRGKNSYDDFICKKTRNAIMTLYMGSLKQVNAAQCANFIQFAGQYPEIKETYFYVFFEKSREYACNRDIAKFIDSCKEYYPGADNEDRTNLQKLAYRMCITEKCMELLKAFYEYCLPLSDHPEVTKSLKQKLEKLNIAG